MGKFLYYTDIHAFAKYFVKVYNKSNEIKISLEYLYSLDNIEEKLSSLMEEENQKRRDFHSANAANNIANFETASKNGKKGVQVLKAAGFYQSDLWREVCSKNGKKNGGKAFKKMWEERPEYGLQVVSKAGTIGIQKTWEYYRNNPEALEKRSQSVSFHNTKRKELRESKELTEICNAIQNNDWFELSYIKTLNIPIDFRRIGALLRKSDLFEKKKISSNKFLYRKL